jgi:dihydrolipoamide dehydrogenase
MKEVNVDVAVIGAGTAGLAAYRAAVAAGRSAVIIEGGPYGTTCARVGCMPSKLLIAAAEAAHATEKWDAFGIRLDGSVRIDGEAVMARVRRERDRFVGFVLEGVDSIPAGDKLRGHAKFLDDRSLQVDDHTVVTFGRAVIATGSSPSIPPVLKGAGDRLIVNDDVFDWNALPESAAVFGPGVIGLELGQALHRLGVRMELFGRGHYVGPFSDPDLKVYATQTFANEFPLHADAKIERIERVADGVRITQQLDDGRVVTKDFQWMIAATGRAPNVKNLGLENTSVRLGANGVPEFDRKTMQCAMQCGSSHIFIAGDANNDLPLLHEAADEGRIAGENAARFPAVQPGLRREPIAVVFSDPQLATVGKRFADLVPDSFVTGEVSFENQGRSRVMLRNKGLLHVYADKASGLLVGCEMIGPDIEHLAHLLAWAMQSGMTVQRSLEMPFYHPVVEEGLRTALRDAAAKLAAR